MTDFETRFRSLTGHVDPQWLGGDAAAFKFSLDRVVLKSGTTFAIEPAGVTAIVGANNSGKSTVLRDIVALLSHSPGTPAPESISVGRLEITKSGTSADVMAWLGEHASLRVENDQAGFAVMNSGMRPPYSIHVGWASDEPEIGALYGITCFYGDAQGRFGIGGSVEMRDSITDPPIHPVHQMQDSKPIFDEVSSITEKIFGRPLTIDALGRTVRLRVGRVDVPSPPVDDVSDEYRSALTGLRPLDAQGDGMRSLLGQVLPIVSATYPLVMIDEPEAFLHPPQAYALGAQLGQLAVQQGIQVVVATHDRNLLTGLLASGVSTSVVRLEREGGGAAKSYQLRAEDLRILWTDPVLKYTNVLDGLFHRLVVLAEAEGDCGYLAAALDCPSRADSNLPRSEVLFVPTGGWRGMSKVATALRAAHVPTVAAPDLDVLSDMANLKVLVESVGTAWTDEMEQQWKIATVDLRAKREPATVGDVLDALTGAFGDSRSRPYTNDFKKKFLAQTRSAVSPWADVKDYGILAFKGDARAAVTSLMELLDGACVVLVREGELEHLAPEISERKGPGWLQAALAAGTQCNSQTQSHVDRILAAGAA